VQNKTLEDLSETEPTVEELQPGIAAETIAEKAASPEQATRKD
jgi:hypothetical protein